MTFCRYDSLEGRTVVVTGVPAGQLMGHRGQSAIMAKALNGAGITLNV